MVILEGFHVLWSGLIPRHRRLTTPLLECLAPVLGHVRSSPAPPSDTVRMLVVFPSGDVMSGWSLGVGVGDDSRDLISLSKMLSRCTPRGMMPVKN